MVLGERERGCGMRWDSSDWMEHSFHWVGRILLYVICPSYFLHDLYRMYWFSVLQFRRDWVLIFFVVLSVTNECPRLGFLLASVLPSEAAPHVKCRCPRLRQSGLVSAVCSQHWILPPSPPSWLILQFSAIPNSF